MQLKTEALWDWFVENEPKIRACIIDDDEEHQEFIVHHLNELILDLGTFTWEIGQDRNSSLFMIISPNGDREGLKTTRQVVSKCPKLTNWNFHPARPAKEWDRQLSVYNEVMDLVDLDASEWCYRLENAGEDKFNIAFSGNDKLDEEAANRASNLVLVNEIGEEMRIRRFERITYLPADESSMADKSLDHLKADLQKAIRQ